MPVERRTFEPTAALELFQPFAPLAGASLMTSMGALDDPGAQPKLPHDCMIYTPDADDYEFRHAKGARLFGHDDRCHWRHVAMNFNADSALGAFLAALAARSPETVRRSMRQLTGGLVEQTLFMPSVVRPGTFSKVTLAVDQKVPVRRQGGVLGARPGTDLAIWPLVLAKSMLKLTAVLCASGSQPLRSTTWEHHASLLTGRNTRAVPLTGTTEQRVEAVCQLAAHPNTFASVLLGDAPAAQHNYDDGSVRPALGGLGVHARSRSGDVNVLVLGRHYYSVVCFDDARAPTRVLLSNSLGYNPDAAALEAAHIDLVSPTGRFFLPEQLQTLPHAPAEFWLPLHWLARLGTVLQYGTL